MRQWLAVVQFELAFRRRHPPLYIFGGLCFVMAFLIVGIKGGMDPFGGVGKIAVNSPAALQMMLLTLSIIFGLVITTAFVASAVNRDNELGTQGLFFSTQLRKAPYLLGRFFGALFASWGMISGLALGAFMASLMPWQNPERMVAVSVLPYVYSLTVFLFPNLVFVGALAFAAATLTRRLLFSYIALLGLLVLYSVTGNFMSDLDNDFIAAVSDPFGIRAYSLATRYWTPTESNTLAAPLTVEIVVNRLVWLSVGALVLAGTLWRYRMALPEGDGGSKKVKPDAPLTPLQPAASPPKSLTAESHTFESLFEAPQSFGLSTALRQLWFQTRVEVLGLVRSVPFLVIALFGVANIVGGSFGVLNKNGTTTLPVTHLMLTIINGGMSLFILIVVVFYAGELVHREKRYKLSELYDTFPVPNWVPLLSKLVAMLVAIWLLLTVAAATTVTIQLAKGYTALEPELYLQSLVAIQIHPWIVLSVAAIAVQVFANHKFLGYLLMTLVLIKDGVLSALDFEHHLYNYGSYPSVIYSDMNGFGHFMTPRLVFSTYWAIGAAMLLGLAELLWVRGTDNRWRLRLQTARSRLSRPRVWAAATSALLFLATGSFIFYNTNVLNRYLPSDELELQQVRYEKEFKQFESLPHPRVTDVSVEVELYPQERRVVVRGQLHLVNKTAQTIDQLHVSSGDSEVQIAKLDIPNSDLSFEDKDLGYRIYTLAQPLAPGAELDVSFDYRKHLQGFGNSSADNSVVGNGTFFRNFSYTPHFGYFPSIELTDPNTRRDHDLPPRPRMAKIDNALARGNTYISSDSDWVTFKATVSTSLNQVAVAPGTLKKEWIHEGRRYFRYEMGTKILNFWSILSAEYDVRRDEWQPCGGGQPVAIEVFYHPRHTFNVDKMVSSVKESLDYFTKNFSPYQHSQVRILEFPQYANLAQSFPNTIPYSESLGFIADASASEDIDYVRYVTAHEVAHQWWAHQVIGADVQGSTVMSESLAQYSALMVMEKHYGVQKMPKFLKYELNRYLKARSRETSEEMPLLLVENQPYIHYRKASLVFYALKSYIGENAINGALRQYISEVALQSPPYTVSTELYAHIKRVTPDKYQYLLKDLFEKITLYDNRMETATVVKREDGKFAVHLTFQIAKLYADGKGVETPAPALNDWIEVGVYAENDRATVDSPKAPLYLEKHYFNGSESELTVVVNERPTTAGLDPRNLLIDREPDDNRRSIDW